MSGWIDEQNTTRIKSDAGIAIDALQSIFYGGGKEIHTDYLKEKVCVAQRCLDFMKHFIKEEDKYEHHYV